MKPKLPGQIVFDPKTQPGYQSRRRGVNTAPYLGDVVVGTAQPRRLEQQPVDLPQGLRSFQLPQVFPSRRILKGRVK